MYCLISVSISITVYVYGYCILGRTETNKIQLYYLPQVSDYSNLRFTMPISLVSVYLCDQTQEK